MKFKRFSFSFKYYYFIFHLALETLLIDKEFAIHKESKHYKVIINVNTTFTLRFTFTHILLDLHNKKNKTRIKNK